MEDRDAKVNTKKFGFLAKGKADVVFVGLVLVLLTIGLIMMFSASYFYSFNKYGNSYKFILKQGLFAVVGVVAMFVLSKIDYHVYRKFAVPIYVVSIILLALVLALPEVNNVHRWISIPGIGQFQPSEIGKFAIVLLFSHLMAKYPERMNKFSFICTLLALLVFVCGLVVVETHVSATVLILCIGIVLLIVGGLPAKYITLGGILAAALGAGGVFALKYVIKYASTRIDVWLDPWADTIGDGFQTIQSLLAIGSGGLFGRGIGQSRQKYLWVPEPHNDFIFSIVCEELGYIGALIIILIFCALVWRGFEIAMHAPDRFGSLMAVGLTFQVGLQAMLNILVVTNTIPNTGISLPFFSYGGTALCLLLAQMGIVLSVSRASSLNKL